MYSINPREKETPSTIEFFFHRADIIRDRSSSIIADYNIKKYTSISELDEDTAAAGMEDPEMLSLGSLNDRLREFRAASLESCQVLNVKNRPLDAYDDDMPTETDIVEEKIVEEKIAENHQKNMQNLQKNMPIVLLEKFKDMPDISLMRLRPVTYDFLDNKLLGRSGIHYERLLDSEVAELGRVVIPQFASGFSGRGAAAIFLLAYHVKKPGTYYTEYLFDGIEDLNNSEDTKYTDYTDDPIVEAGRARQIQPTGNDAKEAAVYSYIAATALRLFTKPPRNYTNAWHYILDGFRRFYHDAPQVVFPAASEASVKSLASCFAIDGHMKAALFRLLYVSNKNRAHDGFKRFMYDIHLLNTGMHIVDIMSGLARTLGCSMGVMLTVISTRWYRDQVKCLVRLQQLRRSKDDLHMRKMWRYGRIFDETFMADLQTKSCPMLVYVLAAALQMEDPVAHKDILNIAQLKDVSIEKQRMGKVAAEKLLSTIKQYLGGASSSGDGNI